MRLNVFAMDGVDSWLVETVETTEAELHLDAVEVLATHRAGNAPIKLATADEAEDGIVALFERPSTSPNGGRFYCWVEVAEE